VLVLLNGGSWYEAITDDPDAIGEVYLEDLKLAAISKVDEGKLFFLAEDGDGCGIDDSHGISLVENTWSPQR
jgi:hypothetical protein